MIEKKAPTPAEIRAQQLLANSAKQEKEFAGSPLFPIETGLSRINCNTQAEAIALQKLLNEGNKPEEQKATYEEGYRGGYTVKGPTELFANAREAISSTTIPRN